ncbi:MAG TPA: ATP-binding protein [Candidatus Saccharimonadales bacterium]
MHERTLFLMVGYPGSGKTTIAKYIHELTGAEHLWADHERNKLFANPTHDHQENIELYKRLNQRTKQLLQDGKSVIFDTNFNFYRDRKRLRHLAATEGARTVVVWVTTPRDLSRERATIHAHGQDTRIWGNMPPDRFERIADNLQEPEPGEHAIKLDGTNLTREDVEKALAAIEA